MSSETKQIKSLNFPVRRPIEMGFKEKLTSKQEV